ncbi:MAG TPA: hypothetical protein PLA25_03010 [Anaerolineaceae bacterium]|jgi:nitrogen regulatory protein PII|nr:hypothetical protein [Longilinea sp.]HQN43078.1 hypothetical protein [Anaerolineaceae bacterium]
MYIVFCVLDDPNKLDKVLDAWKAGGIKGVTIVESTGMHRHQKEYVPMRYIFGGEAEERGNLTLFVILNDRAAVERCMEMAESVVGDFNGSNTGIFAAWPLEIAKGLDKATNGSDT